LYIFRFRSLIPERCMPLFPYLSLCTPTHSRPPGLLFPHLGAGDNHGLQLSRYAQRNQSLCSEPKNITNIVYF
jgi:hypothetical protein